MSQSQLTYGIMLFYYQSPKPAGISVALIRDCAVPKSTLNELREVFMKSFQFDDKIWSFLGFDQRHHIADLGRI